MAGRCPNRRFDDRHHRARRQAGARRQPGVRRSGDSGFHLVPGLDRRARRHRSRRPRAERARSQERQSHRRRPAQRQAVVVPRHQSQPDPAEDRRHRGDAELRQRRAAVAAAGRDDARRLRPPHRRHRDPEAARQGPDAGDAAGGRIRARSAAVGPHPRRHRARRHPAVVDGRILVEKGFLIDVDEPLVKIAIDRAEFSLDWDAQRQSLVVPFQIVSGGNRVTLLAQDRCAARAPRRMGRGGDRRHRGAGLGRVADPNPLILNRFLLRLRVDSEKQRIDVEQGDIGNMEVGLAVSGNLDYSTADPRLALGVAGNRMSVAAMKKLWLFFITPKVRNWVDEHVIERHGRAARDRHQCADVDLAHQRAAGARRRPVDRDRQQRRRDPAGRRAAVDPRRRPDAADLRPQGDHQSRPRQRRDVAGPQARDHQRRVRGARHVPERAARQVRFRLDGPVPAAAELLVAGSAARFLRRAARSGHQPRHARGAGLARPAAQGRSAARLVELHHQHGRRQFLRRAPGDGPEGRGAAACASSPTIRAIRSRATSSSTASRRRSTTASRAATAMPRCASRHARRGGAHQARLRSRRLCERAGADQDQRPGRRIRRRREPLRDRRRPDPGADRQSAAGLDQAGRQVRARDLHGREPAAGRPASTTS